MGLGGRWVLDFYDQHGERHWKTMKKDATKDNIKYIQSQLGHSSPTITLNVYAHLMKPTNQEAACRLENSIFGSTGHRMVTKS